MPIERNQKPRPHRKGTIFRTGVGVEKYFRLMNMRLAAKEVNEYQ
jgi:hypothetical protein